MGDDDTAEAVAYDKKYGSYKGAGRNEFLVVRSQEHTHDVGNNKSDKANHPCCVNGESHNEGADEKIPLAVKVEIRPHRDCRFIAEEHKVQHTALCPEKKDGHNDYWRDDGKFVPFRPRQTSHQPVSNALHAFLIIGKVHDEAGKSAAYRRECHACQEEFHGI